MTNGERFLLLTAELSAIKRESADAEERLSVRLDFHTTSLLGRESGNISGCLEGVRSAGLPKLGR